MLSLSSDEWSRLTHAYGAASDIPELLTTLSDYPGKPSSESEPFFSLWSSLCHQGDTYTASYAAVPHIIRLAEVKPNLISYDFLLLPTSIEIARLSGRGPKIPAGIVMEYSDAIKRMPKIVGQIKVDELDETWCLTCAAAIAISAGNSTLAEAILELEGDSAAEFLNWKFVQ